jgi:hypothetical protein
LIILYSLISEIQDELLEKSFLIALKSQLKQNDLPILTSKFFKACMQPCWYGLACFKISASIMFPVLLAKPLMLKNLVTRSWENFCNIWKNEV